MNQNKTKRILFICKRMKFPYDLDAAQLPATSEVDEKNPAFSSGLFNSALQVVLMLRDSGVEAQIVQVNDNNDIDREVTSYRPTHVIIEALWVVPSKFEILKRLHPSVKWIVRIHSNVPFLATEGIAIDWVRGYLENCVDVAVNNLEIYHDFVKVFGQKGIMYLPNYYKVTPYMIRDKKPFSHKNSEINVGCFGAIRPMKNQLIQAIAAMRLADSYGVKLRFHVNTGRIENEGGSVIRNLRWLFSNSEKYTLVEHGWYPHETFVKVAETMDIGFQFSLSETFNIVSADMVNDGVPMVGSYEIRWLPCVSKANPTSVEDMVCTARRCLYLSRFGLTWFAKYRLKKFCRKTKRIWLRNI